MFIPRLKNCFQSFDVHCLVTCSKACLVSRQSFRRFFCTEYKQRVGFIRNQSTVYRSYFRKSSTMSSSFTIWSPAFGNNQTMPKKYTADGENVSPPLQWSGVPVRNFVIFCYFVLLGVIGWNQKFCFD